MAELNFSQGRDRMSKHIEDSDMKIVGAAKLSAEDSFDVVKLVEETKVQRFNGNHAKAKTLGANIVSAFSYKAAPEELTNLAKEHNIELTDELLLQMKILTVFSAEFCLDSFLPSPMLSTVAVAELYDVLEDISPDFYEELSRSAAFSFYHLSLKKECEDKAGCVGEQFAALCGKKGEPDYIALGTELHNININVFKKAIQSFRFV